MTSEFSILLYPHSLYPFPDSYLSPVNFLIKRVSWVSHMPYFWHWSNEYANHTMLGLTSVGHSSHEKNMKADLIRKLISSANKPIARVVGPYPNAKFKNADGSIYLYFGYTKV